MNFQIAERHLSSRASRRQHRGRTCRSDSVNRVRSAATKVFRLVFYEFGSFFFIVYAILVVFVNSSVDRPISDDSGHYLIGIDDFALIHGEERHADSGYSVVLKFCA